MRVRGPDALQWPLVKIALSVAILVATALIAAIGIAALTLVLLLSIRGVRYGEDLPERALAMAFAVVTLLALVAVSGVAVDCWRFGAALVR
jgi:hypothetical protein